MKLRTRILALLLVLVMCFGIVACAPAPAPDPAPDEGNTEGDKPAEETKKEEKEEEKEEENALYLVKDKKAAFGVVYTAASGKKAKDLADELALILKNVKASDKSAVADTAAEAVTDFEVVIGCNPENRTAGLADKATLGTGDWKVELVGSRILIYGSTDDAMQNAYDYFLGSVLKLSATSTKLAKSNLKIDTATFGKTYRKVESVTVNGEDMNGFAIVYDDQAENAEALLAAAEKIASTFASYAGVSLTTVKASESSATERLVKFVKTEEAGDTGFRVRPDGKNLLVEYKYDNTFVRSVNEFCDDKVTAFKGAVVLDGSTVFAQNADRLYYEDFGAVGDGKTNDFLALYDTHIEANKTGQTVYASDDATYYIGHQENEEEIPVMTDVRWGKAHFIIDDTIIKWDSKLSPNTKSSREYERELYIFHIKSAYTGKYYYRYQLRSKNGGQDVSLAKGATNITVGDNSIFEGDRNLIIPYYSGQRIFIREGINGDKGSDTSELLMIDKDGNIGENTFVEWEYPYLTGLTVVRVDDAPLTIDGGIFTTWANNAPREYTAYYRTLRITRSNVTFTNIEHYVEKEYEDGAPYGGFFGINTCTDITIKDCVVTGHKAYHKLSDYNNVMGSYDLGGYAGNNIKYLNVTQSNSIVNQDYWGVHGTNFCKNFTFEDCYLSRIDAHSGMFNITVKNTVLGQFCNCIGGGKLYMENVRRVAGNDFITLRIDYGSTWHGEMEFKNCSMDGCTRAYENIDDENQTIHDFIFLHGYYRNHNFGFDCYMTTGITIDGFKCGKDGKGSLTLLQIDVAAWPADKRAGHPYVMPETITIKGFVGKEYKLTNDTGNLCNPTTTKIIDLDKQANPA